MGKKLNYFLIFLLSTLTVIQAFSSSRNLHSLCPQIFQRTFKGYVPKGNLTAGRFEEILDVNNLRTCIVRCCMKQKCNVAFMSDDKCYHVQCTSNSLCVPTLNLNPESVDHISMVLVKPVGPEESWEEVLQNQDFSSEHLDREMYNMMEDSRKFQDIYNDIMEESTYPYSCSIGGAPCIDNEVCIPNHPDSRAGTCQCKKNYIRNNAGVCILLDSEDAAIHEILTERILNTDLVPSTTKNSGTSPNQSMAVTRRELTITSENKEVKLPEDQVTLTAFVTPDISEEKYQFEWTSLQQPEGSTAVKHQNGGKLQLSKLSEGLYTFKVSASTANSYGETFVNVTVLPPSRINKPPKIIITPANQIVKQPNAAAVLDASSSTDDGGIVSWHWELQQGPLGYQPQLKDSSTLQLNDLTKPGNYTFKLTVTDSDKATSSATANITVLKFTDYPPEANAGEDKIIYLPHNKITLSGNLSTDDHAITTWEWTKSPDDAQKAVDMQDTRTPYLQLSNLEEGMYTFTLKVTDSANQNSTAQVHVFVKPPTNKPPVAVAGHNITISLPQTWVVVDASNSTDDNKIITFRWEQLEGPSTVSFTNVNSSKTNVTGLTKGNYAFKVSVTDDNNNIASDKVYVTVNQNKNEKPIADAGPDFEVELPKNVVSVNGSASKDDWAIVKWKWTRAENSLAMGYIAENTDTKPVLIITDVAVGKYVFNLTVYDEQGLSDTDQVVFIVKQDPKLFHLVEITIDIEARYLSEMQYNNLKGKLALLVKDGSKLQVRNVKPEVGSGRAVLTFYVEEPEGKALPANEVVQTLRQKLRIDASLLGFIVSKLQTTVCQNNCSGHGICNEKTRICECEAFWMRDMFKVYLETDEDSDCSWSILYVVLGVICSVITFLGALWFIAYLIYSWCTKRHITSKPMNYKLIEDTDDLPPFGSRKGTNLSDSDTDSDVVFESRTKPNRFDSRNGHKPSRNGFTKLGRRVKT